MKQGGGILYRAFGQGRCAGPLADDMEVVENYHTKRIYWVGLLCSGCVGHECCTGGYYGRSAEVSDKVYLALGRSVEQGSDDTCPGQGAGQESKGKWLRQGRV